MRDGVAHLDLGGALDAGNDISYVPAANFLRRDKLHLQYADLFDLVVHSRREELDLVTLADGAVLDLEVSYNAAEGVENRVEDEGLKRRIRVPDGGRNLLHYGIEDGRYAFARAGGDLEHVLRVAAEQVADLVRNDLYLGRLHIDLVKDRDDLQAVVDGLVEVGDGLGLDTLRCVHDQQGAFAGCDGT